MSILTSKLTLKNVDSRLYATLVRVLILILLSVIMTIVSPVFLSARNISNIITNASVLIILGVGETIAIITAGTDLSIGSTLTITSVIAAIMLKAGINFLLAISAALIVGVLIGLLNGFLITRINLPPFISTYGLQWAIFGFAYVILKGYVIYDFDPTFRFIGNGNLFGVLPMPIFVMLIVVLAGTFLLSKTTFGREFYAVGANSESAEMSAVNTKQVVRRAFIISGFLSAVAGIVLLARINAIQANIGQPYLLPTIATVYMGGARPAGGQGSIFGTVIGALIMTIVSNGMNLLGVPSVWRDAIIGAIIIATVLMDALARKRLEKA